MNFETNSIFSVKNISLAANLSGVITSVIPLLFTYARSTLIPLKLKRNTMFQWYTEIILKQQKRSYFLF